MEKWSDTILTIEALILQKLTNQLPTVPTTILTLRNIKPNDLGDSQYNIPGKIDVLLGANIYGQILIKGITRKESSPTAHRTTLGWIISGPTRTDL